MASRIAGALLAVGIFCLLMSFQTDNLSASVARGKIVYEGQCISCHMVDGAGLEGAFPPLAETGRLTDKARLVKILFNGMTGPITVKGQEYDMEMMPMNLTDEQVADVLNYIRNSWGNKGDVIKVNEVKQLKAAK